MRSFLVIMGITAIFFASPPVRAADGEVELFRDVNKMSGDEIAVQIKYLMNRIEPIVNLPTRDNESSKIELELITTVIMNAAKKITTDLPPRDPRSQFKAEKFFEGLIQPMVIRLRYAYSTIQGNSVNFDLSTEEGKETALQAVLQQDTVSAYYFNLLSKVNEAIRSASVSERTANALFKSASAILFGAALTSVIQAGGGTGIGELLNVTFISSALSYGAGYFVSGNLKSHVANEASRLSEKFRSGVFLTDEYSNVWNCAALLK
jgi:hypothetical protein